jgi:hypothetical protein
MKKNSSAGVSSSECIKCDIPRGGRLEAVLGLVMRMDFVAQTVCPKRTVHGARLGENDGDLFMNEPDPGLVPAAYDAGDAELYLRNEDLLLWLPTSDTGLSAPEAPCFEHVAETGVRRVIPWKYEIACSVEGAGDPLVVALVNSVSVSLALLLQFGEVGDFSHRECALRFVPLTSSDGLCEGEGMHLGFLGCNRKLLEDDDLTVLVTPVEP